MLTNPLFQKIASSALMFGMFCMMIAVVGCSENSENSIANSNVDEVVVITTPEGEKIEILQSEIDMYIAQSESFQVMINAMDPFVTENKDGSYQFDSVGFNAVNHNLNYDNEETYGELTKGIPIINKQILEERKSPGSTALGVSCHYYWWGKKCCYTDGHAWWVAGIFGLGAAVPGFNIILYGFSQWAAYLTNKYGGFCLNQSWAGGFWLTSP